jgi:ferritin
MNNYEWTAFCHGASLSALAKWRNEGWQEQCSHCRSLINYGWTIRDDKLIGLKCCNGLIVE